MARPSILCQGGFKFAWKQGVGLDGLTEPFQVDDSVLASFTGVAETTDFKIQQGFKLRIKRRLSDQPISNFISPVFGNIHVAHHGCSWTKKKGGLVELARISPGQIPQFPSVGAWMSAASTFGKKRERLAK